jgi:glutaredoxin 2
MHNTNQKNSYSLYHYDGCPFCLKTRRALQDMKLDDIKVTEKDILSASKFKNELLKGGGKAQVPCLKIENSFGDSKWLYESDDIIRYFSKMLTNV